MCNDLLTLDTMSELKNELEKRLSAMPEAIAQARERIARCDAALKGARRDLAGLLEDQRALRRAVGLNSDGTERKRGVAA